jgi:hypothetical protein
MEKSLKELLADQRIRDSLSGTEQNILRMAGNGKSHEAIAKLYGCSEAEVARIIEGIRTRVASAMGGTLTKAPVEPKPSGDDSSQARRAPSSQGSTPSGAPPAKDRVLAYLREHGESRQGDVARGAGVPSGSILDAVGALRKRGLVSVRHEGRAKLLSLPDAPEGRPERSDEPEVKQQPDWIDQYVNRRALRERIVQGRAELVALTKEVDQLEQLASVLGGVGVL